MVKISREMWQVIKDEEAWEEMVRQRGAVLVEAMGLALDREIMGEKMTSTRISDETAYIEGLLEEDKRIEEEEKMSQEWPDITAKTIDREVKQLKARIKFLETHMKNRMDRLEEGLAELRREWEEFMAEGEE